MSKQIITGIREYKFTDDRGREVEGLSVYYKEPLESKDGFTAKGFTAGKFSVKPNTELYRRMLAADYREPFEADVIFDIMPGSKRATLSDIVF